MGAHAPIYHKLWELTVQRCPVKCKCPEQNKKLKLQFLNYLVAIFDSWNRRRQSVERMNTIILVISYETQRKPFDIPDIPM